MNATRKSLSVLAALALIAAVFVPLARVSAARAPARLSVVHTATAGFTRAYQWQIVSAAVPAAWTLLAGDDALARVGVRLTQAARDSAFTVSGSIRIHNSAAVPAILTGVTETITPGARRAVVICPARFPHRLAAGAALECTYTATLTGARAGAARLTVRTRGAVAGASASAGFAFSAPTQVVNAAVNVTAGGAAYGPFSAPSDFSYNQPLDCAVGNPNATAEIVETGQQADAQLSLVCFNLEIAKSTQTFHEGGAWGMRGGVEVRNPGGAPAYIAAVVEELDRGALPVQVDCGHDFSAGPYRIEPGGALSCTFNAAIPDTGEHFTLTRVTAETSHYDPDGDRMATGVSDYLAGPDPLGFEE